MTTFTSSSFDKVSLITLGLLSTWVMCPFLGRARKPSRGCANWCVRHSLKFHKPETLENITHLKYTEEKKIKKIIKQQTLSLQLEEDGDLGNIILIFLNISSH